MASLPPLTQRDRLLLLAPHPDDEALAAGGLLQRAARAGASVRVIFLTDGDKNPWPQRVIERRWRTGGDVARARWGALRRREALASLAALGHGPATAAFWSLPDQGLTDLLLSPGSGLIEELSQEIAGWQPTWLAAPSASDRHPDHSALGVATTLALRERGRSDDAAPTVLSYLVHGHGRGQGAPNSTLLLSEEEVATKRSAILCHRSQTLLSRRRFLAHARRREVFLPTTTAKRRDAHHPLRSAHWEAGGLNLGASFSRLSHGLFRLLARRELLVLVASETNQLAHLRLGLPASARINMQRFSPVLGGPPASTVFIKLDTGLLLYDSAGWLELGPNPFLHPAATGALTHSDLVAAPR